MATHLVLGLGLATAALAAACGGGSDCGEGTKEVNGVCKPNDSSGTNSGGGGSGSGTNGTGGDTGTASASGGGGNSGASAPTFGGVTSVSPASATSVIITWDPASDDVSPPEKIRYAVYLSDNSGGEQYGSPQAIVPEGSSYYIADGLTPEENVFVVVRAIDEANNQDDNTVEKSGKPQIDDSAPSFAGATTAMPAAGGKVRVGWQAATDDLTAPQAMRYHVWFSDTSPVDISGPYAMEVIGTNSADVVVPIPMTNYHFLARSFDAADNSDSNMAEVTGMPGADTDPPVFAGCAMATAIDAGRIGVVWQAATDDTSPQDQLTYTVYAFDTPGPHANLSAAFTSQTFVGTAGGVVAGLDPDTTYYMLCHASDLSGNEDANTVEKSAQTLIDTVEPTFGGATGALLDVPATSAIKITWDPASDDQLPVTQMNYDIYQASAPGAEDFMAAPAMTVVGVTETIVTLPSRTTAYFVVRARDSAGNHDHNNVEVTATTETSLNDDVQPVLTSICTNCHSITATFGNHPYFDNAPSTYSEAVQTYGDAIPFDPVNSRIIQYISWTPPSGCPYMPYNDCTDKLSQSDIQIVYDWILQGAKNN